MKLIFRCMGEYAGAVWAAITLKLMSALMELMLPYILEWIIDDVVPTENLTRVPAPAQRAEASRAYAW